MGNVDKFAEYSLFVEDTARFTERRQMVTTIYVTANTVLLSGIALLLQGASSSKWPETLAVAAAITAGVVVCLCWRQLISRYRALIGLRIRELRRMEELPEMDGCHKMYHCEDELYPRDDRGQLVPGRGLNLSDLEGRLPWVFIILYAVFGTAVIIGWAVNLF